MAQGDPIINQGDLNVVELTHLLRENGLPGNPRNGQTYAIAMTEGWWGDHPRYRIIRVVFQDTSGNPLSQPQWMDEDRQMNPLQDPVVGCTFNQASRVFDQIDIGEGPSRFGPLADGMFLITDNAWMDFVPLSAMEITDINNERTLRDHLTFCCTLLENMMADIIVTQRENRDLNTTINNLRATIPVASQALPHSSLPATPMAASTPGGPSGLPPSTFNIGAVGPSYQPPAQLPSAPPIALPVIPSAPLAPAVPLPQSQPPQPMYNPYMMAGNLQGNVLPISQIKAVIGETPTDHKAVPLWVAKHAAAIEGVFPTGSPEVRCRVLNSLLTGHGGMMLHPVDCVSWTNAASVLFQRVHGVVPLHQLPKTLEEVAKTEGLLVAYNIGMTFTSNNFDLIWGIIRPLVPGQAAVAMLQGYLDQYPRPQDKIEHFPRFLRRTFEVLGLNFLGQSIRSTQAPSRPNSANRGTNTARGRGGNRGRGRGRGVPPGPPPGRGTATPQAAGTSRSSSGSFGEQPRYNLRPQVNRPSRYGGGPNPARNNPEPQGGDTSSTPRGQGERSGRQRNNNARQNQQPPRRPDRTVNTVRTAQPNPTVASGSQDDNSTPPSTARGSEENRA
ncbi:gag [White-tufted-ear marmoset simian foamy virus]|uniref:Gag polyprotein n=1 Tax=White-tufted-ear marmoset simian foamy virus TaxID=2170205 RepID=D5JWV0_9RETR|nr:gag [White-tufted-ear marmoset simian foamy virus]ADE05999.1 gag [White-tufted-ear marmoset simian foamy virus]